MTNSFEHRTLCAKEEMNNLTWQRRLAGWGRVGGSSGSKLVALRLHGNSSLRGFRSYIRWAERGDKCCLEHVEWSLHCRGIEKL